MIKTLARPRTILYALLLVLAVGLGHLFFAKPAQALSGAQWINRGTILYDGVYYVDTNTTDENLQYAGNPEEFPGCTAYIRFTNWFGSGQSLNGFFYIDNLSQAGNAQYISPTGTRDINNNIACGVTKTEPLTFTGNLNHRRVTFIQSGDTITHFRNNIVFQKTPGNANVFRRTDGAEPCKDLIFRTAAVSDDEGEGSSEEFSDDIWDEGQTVGGSSVLYSVRNGDAGRKAESYTDITNLGSGSCGIDNGKIYSNSAYAMADSGGADSSQNDHNSVEDLIAKGVNAAGAAQGGNKRDDAFVTFVGNPTANLPQDNQGNPQAPGGAGPGDPADSQPVCGIGAGWGWLLCPAVWLTDGMLAVMEALIVPFLQVSPLRAETDNNIYALWNAMRNIANVVFIIAFLVIVFSQATGIGISNYGIKRLLPRVIAVAVLTNISFFLAAFLVDLGNIAGGAIEGLAVALVGNNGAIDVEASVQTTEDIPALPIIGLYSLGAGIITALLVVQGIEVIVAPILIAALLFVVALIILVLRLVIINLIVILSPLIVVAWLLPNTANMANRIMNWFIQLILMYPVIVLGFVMGKIVASLIFSSIPGVE